MKLKFLASLESTDGIGLRGYLGYRKHPLGKVLVAKISDALPLVVLNNLLEVCLSRGIEPRFVSPACLRKGQIRIYLQT